MGRQSHTGYRTTHWAVPSFSNRWEGRTCGNAARLTNAWGEYIARLKWEWFVTLTFDQKRVFPVSRDLASREAFSWCGLTGYLYRRPIAWLYVVERGDTGHWHAHALLIGTGGKDLAVAVRVWQTRNGIAQLQRVTGVPKLAMYSAKTLPEDGEIVLSDTLLRYKRQLGGASAVRLFDSAVDFGMEQR